MAVPASNSADGPIRPEDCPRRIRDTALQATGRAAASARTPNASMAADITTVAAMVAAVPGSDHCQPMMSCDHSAVPKMRKTVTQQASDTRLARACPDASGPHPHNPALASRATMPPRATSAVRAHDPGRSEISEISSSVNSSP